MSTPTPSVAVAPTPEVGTETDIATLLDEPASHAWYRRPALWAGVLLLALVAAGLWYWRAQENASAAPSYTTQTVARGNLTLTVTANGTLQPTRSISIGSELSGTVLKVNVDVNDRIRKGQVLVELDTAKLHDQILRSRASLTAANAKVAQTVATVKEAKASLGRFEEVARLSGGKVPDEHRLELDLLQAVRLAVIMRIFILAAQLPRFTPQDGLSYELVLEMALSLEIPEVVSIMRTAFPHEQKQGTVSGFDEQASYRPRGIDDYGRLETEIFKPMEEAYEFVREIGTGISHHFGAFG